MNFDELGKIIAEQTGVSICPICGMPFEQYHKRQKICGTEECRKIYRSRYIKEHTRRQMEEDADAYRAKRNEIQRRHRRKKRAAEAAERNLDKVQDYWTERADKDRRIEEDGIYYGRRQMEKTLAQVPKIDVEGFRKERKNDNIHDKDTQARSRCDSAGRQDVPDTQVADGVRKSDTVHGN